ncbi:MAG: hypothetical protein ABIJ92_00735 [Candidatus Aenigmatarchaeota archaeon]
MGDLKRYKTGLDDRHPLGKGGYDVFYIGDYHQKIQGYQKRYKSPGSDLDFL